MKAPNPENGRTPAAPISTPSHKAKLKEFLAELDLVRLDHWRELLALQAGQFCRLASLIESKPLSSRGAGPDLSALARHRNMRERIAQPLGEPVPASINSSRG